MSFMCGIVSMSGPNREPLACAYPPEHDGDHSWATLPTFPLDQEWTGTLETFSTEPLRRFGNVWLRTDRITAIRAYDSTHYVHLDNRDQFTIGDGAMRELRTYLEGQQHD